MINKLDQIIIQIEGGQQVSRYARSIANRNKVEIGMHTYGSCFDREFNNGGQVKVGRYCSFASNVRYFGANHPINYASMSPYFYNKMWGYKVEDIKREKLVIGNDVWIGYGVIITSSCKEIGTGSVIAAGAIVTENVPEYAIVMGAPARIKRFRFSEETQKLLNKSRWWELEPDVLMKYYNLIDEPDVWAKTIIKEINNCNVKHVKI
ncbi:CatB-related O-acetyltransferase [Butyrivibrio fibrisolvens]|uniref:CatB-related O-acetyltransferase n=1 Tax=Butyrivibrio fibrisolvens TaxID=831 RepID=UPI000419A379|nr:CatB-related O-acetyltransferase [Butyrivibrio fibrisolvens]